MNADPRKSFAAFLRPEAAGDHHAIRSLNEAAFGRPDEANLVDQLRCDGDSLLSLVAEVDRKIAGHILFSRMWVENVAAVALAPMSVIPEFQNRGIGSQLIRRGLDELRERGERIVIVLGHQHYYPRFGFSTHLARNLQSPFPPEAYMALELSPGALDGVHGKVRYPAAFGL
ncbi:MAG: N-acetyltransferase [Acidobacteriia bacterium]|nr:N-acetyltransferase [Terriglobia bacterium]